MISFNNCTRVLDLGGFVKDEDWCGLSIKLKFVSSWFPAGESFIRIENLPADETHNKVKILCRLNSSNDIFQLIMAVDALRRLKYTTIEAIIPYLCYSRQDRMCNEGEAFSLKVFANILNSLKLDKITTWDAHSSMSEALIDNLEVIDNKEFIRKVLIYIPKAQNLNFISPDSGAEKKIYNTLSFYSMPEIVVCSKRRELSTTKLTGCEVPKLHNDYPCLIIDDICDGGATFVKIVERMRMNGDTNDVYLATTHATYSKGLDVLRPYFKRVFTTNSRNDDYAFGKVKDDYVVQIPIF